jgi:hypothetical protein
MPEWTSITKIEDSDYKIKWVATINGGVSGIGDGRSFLWLEKRGLQGATKLELDRDWLVVSAEIHTDARLVARYNRRTRELKINQIYSNEIGSRRVYSSPPVLHASGAASSNRVWRLRNTKFRLPVGPLRCLAMISSARARSSSGISVL